MTSMQFGLGLSGYLAAAAAAAVLIALVLTASWNSKPAIRLALALGASFLWAATIAIIVWNQGSVALPLWVLNLDALHLTAWIVYLAFTLRDSTEGRHSSLFSKLLLGSSAALTALVLIAGSPIGPGWNAKLFAIMILSLLGLLALEQLFRNSGFDQRRVLKWLSIGIGLIFAIDLVVYSQSVLVGAVSANLWILRGFVNAASVPLMVIAIKRDESWGQQLFISRHVTFYTTTLVGAGLYLLAMASGGFLIASVESSWGPLLQVGFLAGGAVVFFYALFSVSVRRQFKAFIVKNFYSSRYDYREEWLRLVGTLAGSDEQDSLAERSVRALASIVGSPCGELWFGSGRDGVFDSYGAWRMPKPLRSISREDVLVRFLERTHWVVDSLEHDQDPERYANAFATDNTFLSPPCIIIPLIHDKSLVGVVRLMRPEALGVLTFEDHDLLRTAGQQVAIFLAQERAQEQLLQTRQFEAFSKLTAFLMHDLKNLVAQQELVVGNARRFKHRPEFVDDAVRTIEASVRRMKGVLERLAAADSLQPVMRVDLRKLLTDVSFACADRSPSPRFSAPPSPLSVEVDRDKLSMAVTHAVRNAQDATPANGTIEIRLLASGGDAVIEVEDSGCGMDAAFIEEHLFRPFDSTKGAKGMGIGAFQIRETVRAAGGKIEVDSELGRGTVVRMRLPLKTDAEHMSRESVA